VPLPFESVVAGVVTIFILHKNSNAQAMKLAGGRGGGAVIVILLQEKREGTKIDRSFDLNLLLMSNMYFYIFKT
jgi:hypothetical protein